MTKVTKDFEALFGSALDAGILAANDFLRQRPNYHGPCGFAWIDIKPANSGFAKWLVANDHARKGYPSGITVWVGKYLSTQCIDTKERFAYAFAQVLVSNGIKASADSRLD